MSDDREEEPTVQQAAIRSATRDPAPAEPDLGQIFREHHLRVFRAAYRVTGNAEDAEDVLQTVFVRLARSERRAALGDRPEHYLHRAAVNAAIDLVRARHSSRTAPLDDGSVAAVEPPERSPERLQGSREIGERIREALARTSPKSAEIFALRYFEGYDNHEIATMLGTSRSTVNVILHRTRKKLQEDIGLVPGETP